MQPYTGPRILTYHPISRALNDVRNDDSSLTDPVTLDEIPEPDPAPKKKPTDQLSLF